MGRVTARAGRAGDGREGKKPSKEIGQFDISTSLSPAMRAVLIGVIINEGIARKTLTNPTRKLLNRISTKCNEIAQSRGLPLITIAQLGKELSILVQEGKGAYERGKKLPPAPRITSGMERLIFALHARGIGTDKISERLWGRFGKRISTKEVEELLAQKNNRQVVLAPKAEWSLPERNCLMSIRRRHPELTPEELAIRYNRIMGEPHGLVTAADIRRLWERLFDEKHCRGRRKSGKSKTSSDSSELADDSWDRYVDEHLCAIIEEHKILKGDVDALTAFIQLDKRGEYADVTRDMVVDALNELGIFDDFVAGVEVF
ncbi:MAG: hypothetical protein ABII71_00165, partial [Candidatus Micrarchaeota archaeon]